MCKHYDCYYYCPETETCDYYLITGKLRGCLPTDDCDRHCTNIEDVINLRKGYYTPRTIDFAAIRRMEKCYTPDMDTKTLSYRARVSRVEARRWIKKINPDSFIFMGGPVRRKDDDDCLKQ